MALRSTSPPPTSPSRTSARLWECGRARSTGGCSSCSTSGRSGSGSKSSTSKTVEGTRKTSTRRKKAECTRDESTVLRFCFPKRRPPNTGKRSETGWNLQRCPLARLSRPQKRRSSLESCSCGTSCGLIEIKRTS
ncbi:unnamed protein product [Hapterophycus canaliculatus]